MKPPTDRSYDNPEQDVGKGFAKVIPEMAEGFVEKVKDAAGGARRRLSRHGRLTGSAQEAGGREEGADDGRKGGGGGAGRERGLGDGEGAQYYKEAARKLRQDIEGIKEGGGEQ